MYTIDDAFAMALLAEDLSQNKFDALGGVSVDDLTIDNIPDLYNCEYDYKIGNLIKCNNCGAIFEEDEIGHDDRDVEYYADDWDYLRGGYIESKRHSNVDYDFCPFCEYGSDIESGDEFGYTDFTVEDLFNPNNKLLGLSDYVGDDFVKAIKEYIKNN